MRLVSRDHSLILPFRCPSNASSLRNSRDLPVVFLRVPDRRAGAAMFAVPSMAIEEDQVRRDATIDRLVDPIQELHTRARSTLPDRIERLDRAPPLLGGADCDF